MAITTDPPPPPPPLPSSQPRLDLQTGLLTAVAQQHESKVEQWRKDVYAWLKLVKAAVP